MKTYDIDFEANSRLIAADNLKYKLSYFAMHLAGTNPRGILAYAGVDWTPVYPDWKAEKVNAPFELIPVLTVIHPDGKELILAETVAIDIFLAKQFGLHGQNAWEEALINSFYSNSNSMFFQELMNIYFWESIGKSDEEKKKYLDTFLNEQLTNWARIHEAHLANNNSNGHYVGNRVSENRVVRYLRNGVW
jgi:glutathione S-transferase